MKLGDCLVPRFLHSTVVVDIATLGPVAFVLWGRGEDDMPPPSLAQIILIDSQKCNNVNLIIEFI